MSNLYASHELNQTMMNIQKRKWTGCISIEEQVGSYRRYGIIQYLKGDLIAAEYFNSEGEQALHSIAQLTMPNISFSKGAVMLKKQPELQSSLRLNALASI